MKGKGERKRVEGRGEWKRVKGRGERKGRVGKQASCKVIPRNNYNDGNKTEGRE